MQYEPDPGRLQFQYGMVCINTANSLRGGIECAKCYGHANLTRSAHLNLLVVRI
jgi:hypothetical protein